MLIVPEDLGPDTIRVHVLKVFDGDGFLTRIESPRRSASLEVTIRLGFIDAPEMEQPGGEEARDFLQSLIGGKWVDLAILIKMDTGGIFDRHNRIVAVPYLKIDHQGPLVRVRLDCRPPLPADVVTGVQEHRTGNGAQRLGMGA